MNRLIIMSILLVVCFFPGCKQKTKEPPKALIPVPAPAAVEPKKIDFLPPADSSMTADQIKKMTVCNALLDSLSIFYRDSFTTKDAAVLIRLQDDFKKAQDKICLRAGLPGGYKEYYWIFKNYSHPRNAKLLESLQMKVY
jgi:hypothetical protein